MRTLILNEGNVVPGTNNSTLEFTFIGGNVTLMKGQKVALATLQMYYSTFNISALNDNNQISYRWIDNVDYAITIPDGFYDALGLNNFLHFTMIQNGHYLIDNDNGNFVYFIGITPNPTLYKIEVNSYPMYGGPDVYTGTKYILDETVSPTPNTFRRPDSVIISGAWTVPANAVANPVTPMFQVLANNFRQVIGFEAGYYPQGPPTYAVAPITVAGPSGVDSTQVPAYSAVQTFLSTSVPQITPLSSYILNCNLINNDYAVPSTLLYSFSPEASFGSQFSIQPNEYIFIDCLPAQYNKLQIRFTDQNGRPVAIEDPNMVIQILITDPETDTEHQAATMLKDAMKTFAPVGIGRSRG